MRLKALTKTENYGIIMVRCNAPQRLLNTFRIPRLDKVMSMQFDVNYLVCTVV